MLREKPTEKFLLYREDNEPVNPVDNWLLDVQLAHYVFSDDQVTIWAQELGLGIQFHDLIRSHSEFFQSESRRTKLQTLLGKNNTKSEVNVSWEFAVYTFVIYVREGLTATIPDCSNTIGVTNSINFLRLIYDPR